MSRLVTIVIHGTFAAQADWWRLGTGKTFADRLESALAKEGTAETV